MMMLRTSSNLLALLAFSTSSLLAVGGARHNEFVVRFQSVMCRVVFSVAACRGVSKIMSQDFHHLQVISDRKKDSLLLCTSLFFLSFL